MNKEDLIGNISGDAKITKVAAKAALESALSSIQGSLKKGKNVTLVGFGTFSVAKRKARIGRNPQTGAAINIPAKKVVKFKSGKGLSNSVK
jgi:DNA-binding protein HU-beta